MNVHMMLESIQSRHVQCSAVLLLGASIVCLLVGESSVVYGFADVRARRNAGLMTCDNKIAERCSCTCFAQQLLLHAQIQ